MKAEMLVMMMCKLFFICLISKSQSMMSCLRFRCYRVFKISYIIAIQCFTCSFELTLIVMVAFAVRAGSHVLVSSVVLWFLKDQLTYIIMYILWMVKTKNIYINVINFLKKLFLETQLEVLQNLTNTVLIAIFFLHKSLSIPKRSKFTVVMWCVEISWDMTTCKYFVLKVYYMLKLVWKCSFSIDSGWP